LQNHLPYGYMLWADFSGKLFHLAGDWGIMVAENQRKGLSHATDDTNPELKMHPKKAIGTKLNME